MATLHLISNPKALADCLMVAGANDVMVLMEDGVYATSTLPDAVDPTILERVWTIADDVAARGLPTQARDISYSRLVELCVEHQPIATWC